MSFVIRLLALCLLGHTLVSQLALDIELLAVIALATISLSVFAGFSGVICNRRLIRKLGGLHRIFANADNIKHLPYLMRSHEEHVRWWQVQLAYELGIGLVTLLPLLVYAFAVDVGQWWLVGAGYLLALLILIAPTLLRLCSLIGGRQHR
ncbi:MAG: hypothetical protein JSS83_15590 [Cyanobacteria bacterium SZAS LIN-3]|nr:hypothetical protein [Cyanobacteria bacterium SZAS LIN-3]